MKVSVICLADRPMRLPLLVWSLMAQTHADWELIVLDQSANGCVMHHVNSLHGESRIRVQVVPNRGDWGQAEKERAARECAAGDALMFPQDDAYYAPPALELMVAKLHAGSDMALCGWLYDQFGYVPMPPDPRVGRVDVGGFMVRRSTFLAVGWPFRSQTGDGQLVESLVASGARVGTEAGILYVRN